jgi:hypothetical protein
VLALRQHPVFPVDAPRDPTGSRGGVDVAVVAQLRPPAVQNAFFTLPARSTFTAADFFQAFSVARYE